MLVFLVLNFEPLYEDDLLLVHVSLLIDQETRSLLFKHLVQLSNLLNMLCLLKVQHLLMVSQLALLVFLFGGISTSVTGN